MNLFQQIQSRYRNVIIHQHEKPLVIVLPSNENMKARKIRNAGTVVGKGFEAKLALNRKTKIMIIRSRRKVAVRG